jgi:hypothetical protein
MKYPLIVGWINIVTIPIVEIISYILTGDYLRNYVGYYAPVLILLLASCSVITWADVAATVIIVLYGFVFDADSRFYHIGYVVSILQFYFASVKLPRIVKSIGGGSSAKVASLISNIVLLVAFSATSSDHYEGGRYYKSCFVIPHEIAYYLAILSYTNICFGNWWIAVFNFIAIAIIGTRVGLILGGLAVVAAGFRYIIDNKIKIGNPVIVVFGLTMVLIALMTIGSNSEVFNALDALVTTRVSFDLYDAETVQGSSHRALLATTSFEKALSDGLSVDNFLGRGPRWTMQFNEVELGVRVWSHNDLLDLFMCGGLVLPFIYLYSIYRLVMQTKSLFILAFILFAAILNGLFFYPTPFIIGIFTLTVCDRSEKSNQCGDLSGMRAVAQH